MGSSCGTVRRNMAESTFRVKIGQNGEFEEGGMKEMKVLNDHSVLVVKNKGVITAVSNKCTVRVFNNLLLIENCPTKGHS